MSTLLITGGAGFIGSNLVQHALDHTGDRLVIVDKLTYAGSLLNLEGPRQDPRVRFIQADIADRDRPGQVLVDDGVAEHVAGAGHGAMFDVVLAIEAADEILQHGGQARPVGAGIALVAKYIDGGGAGGATHQADTGMRSAHVGGDERPGTRSTHDFPLFGRFAHAPPLMTFRSSSHELSVTPLI